MEKHQRGATLQTLSEKHCEKYGYDEEMLHFYLGKPRVSKIHIRNQNPQLKIMPDEIALILLHTLHSGANADETTICLDKQKQFQLQSNVQEARDKGKWERVICIRSHFGIQSDFKRYQFSTLMKHSRRLIPSQILTFSNFDETVEILKPAIGRFKQLTDAKVKIAPKGYSDTMIRIIIEAEEQSVKPKDLMKIFTYGEMAALAQILHTMLDGRIQIWLLLSGCYILRTITLDGVIEMKEMEMGVTYWK